MSTPNKSHRIEVVEMGIDKLYIPARTIIRESYKWKIYLPQSYKELWEKLRLSGTKVDIIIIIPSNENKQ